MILLKPEVDKLVMVTVIRFLPAPEGCELPAQMWSHAFQGPGGWYIENSLTTLGQKDPVSEYNRTLWNSGRDSDKDIAANRNVSCPTTPTSMLSQIRQSS